MAANPLEKTPEKGEASSSFTLRDFSTPMIDLNDQSIMITGGTGSFGHHFVQTVIDRFKPRRLIIFSRDELKQYEMAQRFSPED